MWYTVVNKNTGQSCCCNIFYGTWWIVYKIWHRLSWMNLSQNDNVPLHISNSSYFVKDEICVLFVTETVISAGMLTWINLFPLFNTFFLLTYFLHWVGYCGTLVVISKSQLLNLCTVKKWENLKIALNWSRSLSCRQQNLRNHEVM